MPPNPNGIDAPPPNAGTNAGAGAENGVSPVAPSYDDLAARFAALKK